MPFITCEVINNKGMHARAAAQIVAIVCQYQSDVKISHNDISAPGDSLLKLLTLNAPKGSNIEIKATGKDSDTLLSKLNELFANGFGE